MKNISTLILLLFSFSMLFGQNEPGPCGTQAYKSPWLKKYQANPSQYDYKRAETIHLAITINRVGQTNGLGKMKETNLLNSMCTLQNDFEDTDIRFYLKEKIRDINDSDFFNHESVIDGGLKMFEYNVDNTINCYLVSDAAGNCGYNLPWAGVAVQESCATPADHTWAHEMGHALALPHPFLGWEGGVWHDFSVAHDYNDPAPEKVLYNYTNFKDSLVLDTVLIDTTFVEKMDRSNCHIAADGFCDTKPDYIYQRWQCNADTISLIEQTDPDGIKFNSDGTLIMSYSIDNCSVRFSEEQILAMRANALDEKPEMSSVDLDFPEVTDPLTIQHQVPAEDETVFFRDIEFNWSGHQDDQYYLFQIGVESTFSVVLFDTIVDNPSLTMKEADTSWGSLFWRVQPFTADNFCIEYSLGSSFFPSESTSASEVGILDLNIYPTVLHNGQNTLFFQSNKNLDETNYAIYSLTGLRIQEGEIRQNKIDIDPSQMAQGMYALKLVYKGQLIIKKFFVE